MAEPNWCACELIIRGEPKNLTQFKQQAVGYSPWHPVKSGDVQNPLNFHSLMPIPESLLGSKYGGSGQDWEIEYWGCRWGAYCTEVTQTSEDCLNYKFLTDSSAPDKLIEHICQRWPALIFCLCCYGGPNVPLLGFCTGMGEFFHNEITWLTPNN